MQNDDKINFRKFDNNTVQSWIKEEDEWQNLIKYSEVCSGNAPKDIHMPWCLSFAEAKLMCEKYQGQMTIITSSEVQKNLFDPLREIANSFGCHDREVWTGFSDTAVEGHFIDVNDGRWLNSLGDFDPFVIGQPNGDTKQNCADADLDIPYEKSWYDVPCEEYAIHSFCRSDENPQAQIRGELKFIMKNLSLGRIIELKT